MRSTLRSIVFALAAGVACLVSLQPTAHAQVRIMPTGDSITDGDSILHTTYRCNLWNTLQIAGYSNVDFVGSQTGAAGQPAVCALAANFDADHEGHSGWKVQLVLNHVTANPVTPPADIVLLHMGVTNLLQDLIVAIFEQTGQIPTPAQVLAVVNNTVTQLGLLIDELRNQNPNVTILIAQIIPAYITIAGNFLPFQAIDVLNAQIPSLVAAKDQIGARVFLVDQNTGYNVLTGSVDGVHPNALGEAKLADGWFPTLKFVLDSIPCTPASSVSAVSDIPANSVCPGDAVVLTASVNGGSGPFVYQWRRNGVAIPNAKDATFIIPSASIANEGSYDCVAGNFCSTFTSNPVAIFPLEFAAPQAYAVGTGPRAVIAGDLGVTPDGNLDLLSADTASDSVTIRSNDGNGGFATIAQTLTFAAGEAPRALALGNFVSGGGLDLAVALAGADRIDVYSDTGSFAFSASIALPSGATNPVALTSGNFDGSGLDDLAIACEGDLFGPGYSLAISFDGATASELPAPPSGFLAMREVRAADLDGDGDLDLVATMGGSLMAPITSDDVLIYDNQGGGTFAFAGALSVDQDPRGLCLGDLDGDGRVDVATTFETAPLGVPGGIAIFPHTVGTSLAPTSFAPPLTFNAGNGPLAIACGDLRDDSIPDYYSRRDLVCANFAAGNVGLLLGFDGTDFDETRNCAAGINPSSILLADLNGDRTLDVVTANVSSNDLSVSLALPRAQATTYGTGCPGTNGLTPQAGASGTPAYGSTFSVTLGNARSFAPVLLGVSLGQVTAPFEGCTLLIAPPIVLIPTYCDAVGASTFPINIPLESTPFLGLRAYFQWFVFDSAGTYQSFLAFSNALRIKFGNP